MKKDKLLIVVFSLLLSPAVSGQTIKNIKASQDGDKVQITYDLLDTDNKDFFIRAYASNDGGKSFKIGVSNAVGDVNAMVKPGLQRKITWNALEEYGEYQGMMRFKIVGLSNTALGKSENKDFILGVMDIKSLAKDKFIVAFSLFCKSTLSTTFSDLTYMVDNFGNSYRIQSGLIGNQSFTNKNDFATNELKHGEFIFQLSKQNPSYTGETPSEFQLRFEYGDGAILYLPKVVIGK